MTTHADTGSVIAWADNVITADVSRADFRVAVGPVTLCCSPDWCTGGTNVSGAVYSLEAVENPGSAGAVTSTVPALVGSYPANSWGLYDFYGNVMEMCLDAYASNADLQTLYAGQDPVADPMGPPTVNATARYHATRGGSYYNSADYTNNNYSRYYCNHSVTGTRDRGVGLRIAVSPEYRED